MVEKGAKEKETAQDREFTMNEAGHTKDGGVQVKDGEKVTWRIALEVWWAQVWRLVIIMAVVGAVEVLILKPSPQFAEMMKAVPFVLAWVWATKKSLEINHKSISIYKKEGADKLDGQPLD